VFTIILPICKDGFPPSYAGDHGAFPSEDVEIDEDEDLETWNLEERLRSKVNHARLLPVALRSLGTT
jgi:hypothetical protein